VYLFVLGGHTDLIPALQSDYAKVETGNPPVCTHRLHYEASDPVLETSNRMGLKNLPQNKGNIIFIPAYLNGHDGLINMTYYEALSGCDLGVFPSYYEPWGYTPQESAAHAVPTISTDQAGFGLWVQSSFKEHDGIMILKRKGRDVQDIIDDLFDVLKGFQSWTDLDMQQRRESAWNIAMKANWVEFYKFYAAAYERAAAIAREYAEKLALIDYRTALRHTFAGTVSTQPHFRRFTAVAKLPEEISRLRELAYNLWWAWNPLVRELFASLDPQLWSEMGNNPVLGGITRLGGSLYTDRKKPVSLLGEIERFSATIRDGFKVVLFPEGTSTNGETIKEFRASLFQVAIGAQCQVLPVCISYQSVDGQPFGDANRDTVCWYGDMDFVPHFIGLLRHRITARISILDPIPYDPNISRAELSQKTRGLLLKTYHRDR